MVSNVIFKDPFTLSLLLISRYCCLQTAREVISASHNTEGLEAFGVVTAWVNPEALIKPVAHDLPRRSTTKKQIICCWKHWRMPAPCPLSDWSTASQPHLNQQAFGCCLCWQERKIQSQPNKEELKDGTSRARNFNQEKGRERQKTWWFEEQWQLGNVLQCLHVCNKCSMSVHCVLGFKNVQMQHPCCISMFKDFCSASSD